MPEKEMDTKEITTAIQNEALRLGFDDIGFSPAEELTENKEHLQKWLDAGYHADMKYMENNFDKRINPAILVNGSKSVISVLKNYFPTDSKLSSQYPKIARYAYGNDYHFVIKEKLNLLFSFIKTELFHNLEGRCFIDYAPLLERYLAAKAGLGWIGKNSMLINRKSGSYFFIGELVINLELTYNNSQVKNGCGTCNRCLENCPVNAITPYKTIDSNKCISYHTIENKGDISENVKNKMNEWIFGCDICQEVCPWNKRAIPTKEQAFYPSEKLMSMKTEDWQNLTRNEFDKLFENSAIKRTTFYKLKENINNIQ